MKHIAIILALLCAGCGPLVEVKVENLELKDVKAIEMKQSRRRFPPASEDDICYDFERQLTETSSD